jgi:hypothetical protein
MRPSNPGDDAGVVVAACPAWPVGVVVVVTPPGGSSDVADGVAGPVEPGSPA